MIYLKEYIEVNKIFEEIDSDTGPFTDELLDKVTDFYIDWVSSEGVNRLTLIDSEGKDLISMDFEDADVLIATVESLFDLDEDDLEWLESYGWVNDEDTDYEYEYMEESNEVALIRKEKEVRDALARKGAVVDSSSVDIEDPTPDSEKEKAEKKRVAATQIIDGDSYTSEE